MDIGVPVTFTDDDSSWTPLHWAANNGNVRLVQRLLEKGASQAYENARKKNPSARSRVTERILANTPLHWAAYRGHADVRSTTQVWH
mmetsp:Transcript_6002/g.23313  ORF Transcript_6002/g.23313 Transcript_6002/m.23313 type:complete len:87 (-) Transcript_6002:3530-3790(-)|eukprot:scaffold429_cov269-Pinguiococcus_pyrenoidosus.AAC.35